MPSPFAHRDDSAVKAPSAVYNWKIYWLAISAAMGSAMFGYDSAFIGGTIALPSFQAKFGLVTATGDALSALKANIVSTFQAGCFFGALFCYYLCEKFGRQICLIGCGVLFNIGVVVQISSPGNVGMIYAGRALTGLAVGASSLIVPQYISECAPAAIRGRLIGIFEMSLQVAQVIGFWVNYGVNQNISSTEDPYIQWEVQTVEEQLQREEDLGAHRSLWKQLIEAFQSGNRSRLFMGMALMIFQNLSGINALNYYSATIFQAVGFTGTSVGLLATGVFGIVKATATIIFMIYGIDKFGRRRSLLVGSVGALVAMFYLGSYTKVSHSFGGQAPRDGGAYVAIVMIYLFAVFYAMSWNGIPWIFCAEVFPNGIRSLCLVFTTCTQWLGQFIIVYSTPYMMTNITYGTFLFFGTSLLVGMVAVYFLMPETKGLSLEEMDILFSAKGSAVMKRKRTDETIAEQRTAENLVPVDEEKIAAVHSENKV